MQIYQLLKVNEAIIALADNNPNINHDCILTSFLRGEVRGFIIIFIFIFIFIFIQGLIKSLFA